MPEEIVIKGIEGEIIDFNDHYLKMKPYSHQIYKIFESCYPHLHINSKKYYIKNFIEQYSEKELILHLYLEPCWI